MAFARWERTIQDGAGNVVTDVYCEVRDADAEGNPLAGDLYSDRDGLVGLTNPFLAADGVPAFHVIGGCYHIRIYKTGYDETFEYVGIGTAQERDIVEGTGDVTGPSDSVDGELAVFDLTTGKVLKRGGLLSTAWAAMVHGLTAKTTPVDADEIGIIDSAASNVGKLLTFANLATWIGTKLGPLINAATGKTTPVDADMLAISDSAASNVTKKVTLTNFKAFLKTYFDTLYQALGSSALYDEQTITSTTTVTKTGLSGYSRVEIYFTVQDSSPGQSHSVQARVSGGTWRSVFSFNGDAGTAPNGAAGSCVIVGFNQAKTKQVVHGNSTNTNYSATAGAGLSQGSLLANSEVWDEVRITSDDTMTTGKWIVRGSN